MGCGVVLRMFPGDAQPTARDANKKSELVIKAAMLIQSWYRRYLAKMERKRLYTWNIFQSLEYAGEQDQLRLYNLFNDLMTHLQPVDDEFHPQISTPNGATGSPVNNDAPYKFNPAFAKMEEEEEEQLCRLTNPDVIIVGPAYQGPHIRFPMTVNQVTFLIDAFKRQEILHPKYLLQLLHEVRKVLRVLPNICQASTIAAQQITVCGDLHGKLNDLIQIFYKNGLPAKDNPYIFNGDFVDRGRSSVDVAVVLFSCLLIGRQDIYINRGNHEDPVMNLRYGFVKEVTQKYRVYANRVIRLFQDVFRWLPLATLIDSRILVCHGGISDTTDLEYLKTIDRHKYLSALRPPVMNGRKESNASTDAVDTHEWKQVLDILWSDPVPQNGCRPNTFRGGGSYFGPDVTSAFLKKHNLSLLIRSHQCKLEGFEYEHNKQVLTIFSASNYYEIGSNKGAYIKLMPDLKPRIVQYSSHKNPTRKLTIKQRIGFVEKSALRSLIEKICSSKTMLLSQFEKYDYLNAGTIKVTDWCEAMTTVLRMDLPWLSLRPKLVQTNADGLIEYRKAFDDFKLQLKYNEDGSMVTEALYRNKDSLETIFRIIDKDNSGQISMDEFEEACTILSQHTRAVIPREHVLTMARSIDINHDGSIDFNEFLEAFRIVDQFGRDLHARRASEDEELSASPTGDTSQATLDWASTSGSIEKGVEEGLDGAVEKEEDGPEGLGGPGIVEESNSLEGLDGLRVGDNTGQLTDGKRGTV